VSELLTQLGPDGYYAVVDARGHLAGILTEYDLVKLVYESGEFEPETFIGSQPAFLGYTREQLRALTAADIMTNDPEYVSPETDIDDLVAIVFKNRRKVVPVIEGHIVLGVVRRRDLLQKVLG
jgi:CBS domain-containing protein